MGSTFNKVAYDPTKDVVVKFYASWDGKSSDLAPEFLTAAKHFLSDPSVLFGEVDIMKNEMEGIDTKDFPKVILFKAGGNGRENVEYKGEMEADKIIAFVEANRGSKLGDSEELWSVCLSHARCRFARSASMVSESREKRGNQIGKIVSISVIEQFN